MSMFMVSCQQGCVGPCGQPPAVQAYTFHPALFTQPPMQFYQPIQFYQSATASSTRASSSSNVTAADEPDNTASISGRVWSLSQTLDGCRLIQTALEEARSDEDRLNIARELVGHIWQAARGPHSNHVIQKCVSTLRPSAVQFVVDEIACKGASGIRKLAKDKYGCRVIQRVLEQCRADQVLDITSALLDEAAALSKHIYGTFVIQHLLEHGIDAQKGHVISMLIDNISTVATDIHGSGVVSTAFSVADNDDAQLLSQAILQQDGLLAAMAPLRHGHAAVKLLLECL